MGRGSGRPGNRPEAVGCVERWRAPRFWSLKFFSRVGGSSRETARQVEGIERILAELGSGPRTGRGERWWRLPPSLFLKLFLLGREPCSPKCGLGFGYAFLRFRVCLGSGTVPECAHAHRFRSLFLQTWKLGYLTVAFLGSTRQKQNPGGTLSPGGC